MTGNELDRRTILQTTGAALAGVALAGCSSGNKNNDKKGGNSGGGGNTIAAGPDAKLVFEPEKLTVKKGTTVTWEFKSAGHNVSAWPNMHEKVSIPEGATGFGTMEKGGDKMATVPKGETFEHTFETTGTFQYVCVPHAGAGMVGKVVVEE